LVAGIVKLDDAGQHLAERSKVPNAFAPLQAALAAGILFTAPWLMRGLSVAGTIAMFLVGGGILAHAVPGLHDWVHHQAEAAHQLPGFGPALAVALPTVVDFGVGVVGGSIVLALWTLVQRLRGKPAH
jgi:predicted DNA repair protein MutK